VTYTPTGFALEIFRKRYALHENETFEEANDRVARHLASAESGSQIETTRKAINEATNEGLLMFGGRITANAGRPKGQMLNCFVVPVADSREGWGALQYDTTVISGTGGGVGTNYSAVRPKGAPIHGTGGYATGAVSIMRIINGLGHEIKNGGGRRVALMQCLNVGHADIEEFLEAKLDLGTLTNANISVNFDTDPEAFFERVKKGDARAQKLWTKIVANALKMGEPGILNGYLANKQSNIWYVAPLESTNPCVPGYTQILTDDGYKRIDSLVGQSVNVWNGFEWSAVQPRVTGHNRRMVRAHLSNGCELTTTENHRYWLAVGYGGEKRSVEAKDLKPGDKLIKHDYPIIEHGESVDFAYSQGFLSGDGMDGYSFAYVYPPKYVSLKRLIGTAKPESAGKVKFEWAFTQMPKSFVPFTWNLRSRLEWLAGLLDSDGTELREGGAQIASVNRAFLLDVQKMLTTMGVAAKVTAAQEAGTKAMPDGHGGQKDYFCQDLYRLLVGAVQMQELKRLGLKCERLAFDKTPQRDATQFVRVVSVEKAGIEETVYCFTEPKRNLGCFDGVVTGQCGEIWLSAYDCCCLGALVLPRFVTEAHMHYTDNGRDGFEVDASIDWATLERTVRTAVRALDNVLTVNHYPLPEIAETCSGIRRIGLGVMGLHDMLLMMGLRYNSDEGLELVNRVMKFIKHAAYEASIELAQEKGAFPKFDADRYLRSGFVRSLKPSIRSAIRNHGIRNCALLTIAPTGTTSMVQAVTSGIEPLFSPAYRRKYRDGDALKEEIVIHPLFKRFVEEGRDVSHFQGAHEISMRDHFEMQRVCQAHLDNACSKTINVPPGTSTEELSDLYMEYLPSLKGVTVYPDGSRENQPLTPMPLKEALEHVGAVNVEAFTRDACKDGKCDI
jgi:ribonucleoside-diphosphate reductase alpha chain